LDKLETQTHYTKNIAASLHKNFAAKQSFFCAASQSFVRSTLPQSFYFIR
jgi:hypothetical protein